MTAESEETRRTRLRMLTEQRVKRSARSANAITKEDVRQLIHELEEQRVELEMRNDELRRSQSELEDLRKKYSDLYDLAPVGYVTLDRKGIIQEINLTGAELLGRERARLIGNRVTSFVKLSSRDEVNRFYRRLFESGGREEVEVTIEHGEKSPLDVLLSGVALQDPEGNLSRLQVAMKDITARREAESWRRKLIETTQDAVIAINRKAEVMLFNSAAEKMFGYSSEEIIGEKVNILMPEPYRSEHDRYIERYERTGEGRAMGKVWEVEGLRKDGEVFPIALSVTRIDHEVRYVALIRDRSERAELQAQIIERARLASIIDATDMMAHEVANPLNGIMMSVQLLERHLGEAEDATATATLHRIGNEINRLRHLLSDYRSISAKKTYYFRPVSPASIIEELCALEKPKLAAEGIHVELALEPGLPAVYADPEKVKQALLNLCKNAEEAMPEGGTLTVRGYESAGKVILEVHDTGVGVSNDMDLFQPFKTTKATGTGLGLIIVRQIVSRHQGSLSYTSEPGKGTTFFVSLPVYSASQQPDITAQEYN
jgi:two-component system sensor kinase FixL